MTYLWYRVVSPGASLEVQWLRLHTSTPGGMGSIPGPGTKILHVAQPKINNNKYIYIFNWQPSAVSSLGASLVVQTVKNPPIMQETQVWSLGWKIPWRREWLPSPVFLPGESHGQSSLVGYSPWGHKEMDMTERLTHITYYIHTHTHTHTHIYIYIYFF